VVVLVLDLPLFVLVDLPVHLFPVVLVRSSEVKPNFRSGCWHSGGSQRFERAGPARGSALSQRDVLRLCD
jgi:hypothetical protein